MNRLTLHWRIGVAIALAFAGLAAFALDSKISLRDEPPALVVTFSNLPAAWTLEKTADLTNWFSVLVAGDRPPRDLSLVITNRAQAAFYRIR